MGGGNSTKATSGINGTPTRTQRAQGVQDGVDAFLKDTLASATGGDPNAKPYPLAEVLVYESGPAVEWLIDSFGLDLSLLGRLGGHSFPRTHRGKERFPGMTITYALMEKLEEVAAKTPERAQIITKATATKLLTDPDGSVSGVEYVKDGKTFQERGAVVIATGGYGADFTQDSLLQKYRPDLAHLPTTNGDHCSGDGIKMALAVGGGTKDMERVQVHPTGLINPDEPDAKVKFLAAEALRGCGALLLDANGKRFCNELGRKHYVGRGLMKHFKHGRELAKDMGVSVETLKETFAKYNAVAEKGSDEFGKKFFHNHPFSVDHYFNVAMVTPVIHYCMGGIHVSPKSEVLTDAGVPVPGLFCAGEVMGGTHGINRLGGSSLLDCVVFGRVSGRNVSSYLLQHALKYQRDAANGRLSNVLGHLTGDSNLSTVISQGGVQTTINVHPGQNRVSVDFN